MRTTCKHCGERLVPTGKRGAKPKFCPGCKNLYHRQRLSATYKEERASRTLVRTNVCLECDRTFYSARPQRYCSSECKGEAGRRQNRELARRSYVTAKPLPERACEYCGSSYVPYQRRQRFCNPDTCGQAWHRRDKDPLVGTRIKPRPPRQLMLPLRMEPWLDSYRSDPRIRERHNRRTREAYEPNGYSNVYPRDCESCGASYIGRSPSSLRCPSCADRRRDILMRTNGNYVPSLVWRTVAAQFGMDCYGCGVECVVPTGRFNNPLDATLDHVIPLSRGGQHHYSNVTLLCRGCNARKSDTMPSHA